MFNRPWLLASSLFSIVLTWIVYREFTNDLAESGVWGCEMSWMTPSYVEIPWEESPMKRYRLFWYREQGWDNEETPSGLPVIFIPGNAGSYSQVRSIASSASRQFYGETRGSEELPSNASKLDFCTVDLNEEFSAFHGPTLGQQATYVSQAINHIRSLYPGTDKPPVILLGHSMGGVVARLAAISAEPDSISMILTMATPHTISPAPLDFTTEFLYRSVALHQHSRPNPLLISVCGGISDTQVVSDTCALGPPDLHSEDGFTIFTSGLPGAWTGVDHQAMVWCHQIRWAVARALLEAGNTKGRADQLLRLRRWLSHDKADRQISAIGGEGQRVPITGKEMSLVVRWGRTDLPRLTHCIPGKACQAIQGNVSRIPWLRDESRPFPLSGEGVHTDDVASVVNVQLSSAEGYLEVEGDILASGLFYQEIMGHSLEWQTDPSRLTPLRLRLGLPIQPSSLLSYRLDYETTMCQGHSPVIKVNYHCSDLSESQVLAGNKRHGYLSNHIISAPFLARQCTPNVEVEITQDEGCSITRVKASLAFGPSLAKAVMRYRMAALTWGTGWLALACSGMLTDTPMPILISFNATMKQSWMVALLLIAGSLLQAFLWTVPHVPALFVGQRNLSISILFTMLLAFWTAGLAGLGIAIIEGLAGLKGQTPSTPTSPKPKSTKTIPISIISTPLGYTSAFIQVLLTFLSSLYLPHQLIALGLYIFTCLHIPREDSNYRSAITKTGLYLLTFGLPFNIVILPVWGRYIWADWKHPFPSEHNLLWVIPPLAFLLAVQYGRVSDKGLALRSRYLRWALFGLTGTIFAVGARYPFIIWTAIQGIISLLSLALCI